MTNKRFDPFYNNDPFRGFLTPMDFFNRLQTSLGTPGFGELIDTEPKRSTLVDVERDNDSITVTADLPGFAAEDIELTILDGVLTITAEKDTEETPVTEEAVGSGDTDNTADNNAGAKTDPSEGADGTQNASTGANVEQRSGTGNVPQKRKHRGGRLEHHKVSASVSLGNTEVQDDNITAHLENGVLTVRIPTVKSSGPRKIVVT